LAFAQGPWLGGLQHHRHRTVHSSIGTSYGQHRAATGDFQHGSRLPVHFRRLDRAVDATWSQDQHGRPRQLDGQRVYLTDVEECEVRGHLLARLRDDSRVGWGTGELV